MTPRSFALLASLILPPEDPDRLDAFYERVAPPGFWGTHAARERLARGLRATGAASVTLFAGLLALASALVGAPPPPGWSAVVWIAFLSSVAVLALPFWLRTLRAREEP